MKPNTAGDLATELAPTNTPAIWSLKADGQVLHPTDPAPPPAATIEIIDVTDYPWPNHDTAIPDED